MCVFKTCNAAGVSPPCAVNPFATREVHAIRVLSKRVTCEVSRTSGQDEGRRERRHKRSRKGGFEIHRRRRKSFSNEDFDAKNRRHRRDRSDRINDLGVASGRWRRDLRHRSPSAAASYAPVELQLQCSLGGAADLDALEWRKNDHRMNFRTREVRCRRKLGSRDDETTNMPNEPPESMVFNS